MWFLLFAWIVLLGASAFFAKETLGLDPSQMSSLFSALSAPQRLAASAIVFAALSLIGSAIWQAHRHARQIRLLHARFKGIRDALIAHGSQHDFDAGSPASLRQRPRGSNLITSEKTCGYRAKGHPAAEPERSRRYAGSAGRHPAPPTSTTRDDWRS